MAGIGSTNAMKKGSGNNPFLASTEADMRSFLNSSYVGCIVKYTGDAIQREITDANRTTAEHAQNIVFKKYAFPDLVLKNGASINIFEKGSDGTVTESYIVNGAIKNGVFYYDKSSITTPYVDVLAWVDAKANNANVKAVLYDSVYRWHHDTVNDQQMITLWSYSDDVTFTITGDLSGFELLMYIEPYKVGELYKVAYGGGEYYFEEYCYISEYKTTGNSDYIAPGKTMYDFTGELQVGNGSKVNPYIASTVDEMATYLTSTYKGAFVKYTGETVSVGGAQVPVNPIAVGDTVSTLYFNTSVTPDFSLLDWSNAEDVGRMSMLALVNGEGLSGDQTPLRVIRMDNTLIPTLQGTIYQLQNNSANGNTFYTQCAPEDVASCEEEEITPNQWIAESNPFPFEADVVVSAVNQQDVWGAYISKDGQWTSGGGESYVKNAIYQVTEDGDTTMYMVLPSLVNEGSASDLAQGKQLINSQGDVVEGMAEPGDWKLTKTQERMIAGLSTVYSTDAKYITYTVPSMYKSTLIGVDAPNCELICSAAFTAYRWKPSGSLAYSYSNSAYVPFTLNLPKCKYIGSYAFSNITKLSDIYLPEVEYIGDYAFCHNAGNNAFGDIPQSLYIPKCKRLGYYAFVNLSKLSGVIDCFELEDIDTAPFSKTMGITLNFDPSKIKYLSYDWCTNVSTSSIDFSNIYLPNCIEFAIGSGKNVRTVNLPNCTKLRSRAFEYLSCSSLSLPKCEILDNYAFNGFKNSTTILSLPNVKSIGSAAFAYCSVSSIYCPNVKYIGDWAFSNCRTINITLPTSDLYIKSNAFYSASILSTCSSYNGAYFMNSEVVLYMLSRQSYTEWRNSTVKVLPDWTFNYWGSYLSTVELNAIESLPDYFGQAASIKTLIAPNLVTLNGALYWLTTCETPNVESIMSSCHSFGRSLSMINLPKLRGNISCQNFAGGTTVLSYNLGKVTQLGYQAFYSAKISLYDIPTLRDYLRRGCLNNGNLLKVWLPCVTKIEWGTCQNCTKLSTVLLRSIGPYNGESTFSGCTALSTFIVTAPEAFSFYSDFASGAPIRNGGGSIYVRASLINTFKTLAIANRASFFSSRFTALENLPADVYNTLPMPFDIGSLNYAMTRGSTFEQFCQSPYNAEDYYVDGNYVFTSDGEHKVAKNGQPVNATDVVVDYDFVQYDII